MKANYRTLGPLFGKDMPQAAEAIAALDPARVAAAVRGAATAAATGTATIGIAVGGREHTLSAEDVILTMKAPEGYSVEREGAHAVALDLAIDDDLREEGRAREIVHAVQNARKTAGLEVEDRIELRARRRPGAARGRRGPPRLPRRRDARASSSTLGGDADAPPRRWTTRSRPRSTACASRASRAERRSLSGLAGRLQLLPRASSSGRRRRRS